MTPFLFEDVCWPVCPDGSYQISSNQCDDCSPSCLTCVGSSTTCSSCPSSDPYLYNGNCMPNCPPHTYLSSSSGLDTCFDCSSNCETCSGDASTCSSCLAPTPFLYNQQCWATCPSGSIQSTPDSCIACSPPCETCSGTTSTCTGCSGATPYLLNDTCLATCPDGFYDSANSCLACSVFCTTCSGSATTCTSCPAETPYLSNGACLINTPKADATITTVSETSMMGAVAVSMFSSGGALAILFGVLHKLIGYIKFLNIDYSDDLETMLESWNSELISVKFLPDLPDNVVNQLDAKTVPPNLSRRNISPAFLENFWEELLFLSIALISFIAFTLINSTLTKKKQFKTLSKVLNYLRATAFNFFITQLYFSYGDIMLYSIVELRSVKFNTVISNLSFFLALVFLFFGVSFTIFHIWILRKLRNLARFKTRSGKNRRLDAFLDKYKEFDMLFDQWKNISFTQSAYLLLFTLRDIGLNLVISNFFEHPLVQVIFYVLLTSSFFIYLIWKRPFKKAYQNFQQIVFEAIVLITYTTVLVMKATEYRSDSADIKITLGNVVITIAKVFNIAALTFVVGEAGFAIYNLYKLFKEWRAQKLNPKKVQNDPESSNIKNNKNYKVQPNEMIEDNSGSFSHLKKSSIVLDETVTRIGDNSLEFSSDLLNAPVQKVNSYNTGNILKNRTGLVLQNNRQHLVELNTLKGSEFRNLNEFNQDKFVGINLENSPISEIPLRRFMPLKNNLNKFPEINIQNKFSENQNSIPFQFQNSEYKLSRRLGDQVNKPNYDKKMDISRFETSPETSKKASLENIVSNNIDFNLQNNLSPSQPQNDFITSIFQNQAPSLLKNDLQLVSNTENLKLSRPYYKLNQRISLKEKAEKRLVTKQNQHVSKIDSGFEKYFKEKEDDLDYFSRWKDFIIDRSPKKN